MTKKFTLLEQFKQDRDKFLSESKEELKIPKLQFKENDLEPIMSKETIYIHYDILTKNYFKKYDETGNDFQYAGAFLHEKWWEQFTEVKKNNKPNSKVEQLINENFKSFDKFKEEFEKSSIELHGSGWVYLSKTGTIKTIKNHEVKKDILVLIDLWEHATRDYDFNKPKYLDNIWKIIDWNIINHRL